MTMRRVKDRCEEQSQTMSKQSIALRTAYRHTNIPLQYK